MLPLKYFIINQSHLPLCIEVLTVVGSEHRLSLTTTAAPLSSIIPGQVDTRRYEVLVPLEEGTAHLWRQVVTNTFSDLVREPREGRNVMSNSVIERRYSIATSNLLNRQEREDRPGGREGREGREGRVPPGIQQGLQDLMRRNKMEMAPVTAGPIDKKIIEVNLVQSLHTLPTFLLRTPWVAE